MAIRVLRPIIILGPTAGGKSELAALLADRIGGQVIGADSMQVYRHLDVGTAKPSLSLRKIVKHHLIDIVEPTQRFTVADWLNRADRLIEDLQHQDTVPIVVGGTNLYIKALLEGLFDGPPQDLQFRLELTGETGLGLHRRLAVVDPQAAQRIHPNDRKKLVRALEVHHLTGQPISDCQTQWAQDRTCYRHNPILIGLDWPVEAINLRINRRVKKMFYPDTPEDNPKCRLNIHGDRDDEPISQNLIEETRKLEAMGLLGPQARQALGYKQVLGYLQGRYSEEEAFEKTKILTRRFAKNQRTWLRRFRATNWLDAARWGLGEQIDAAVDFVNRESEMR